MKISIYDRGPIGAKVDVDVDGKRIAFPEHSLRALIDLFTLQEATPEPEIAKKGEIHFLLDPDPVRSQAFQLERENLIQALQECEFTLQQRTEKLQGEIDRMQGASLWKRIRGHYD